MNKLDGKVLKEALASKEMPKVCSARERWHDRKCLDYCDVADYCDYGLAVKQSVQKKVS